MVLEAEEPPVELEAEPPDDEQHDAPEDDADETLRAGAQYLGVSIGEARELRDWGEAEAAAWTAARELDELEHVGIIDHDTRTDDPITDLADFKRKRWTDSVKEVALELRGRHYEKLGRVDLGPILRGEEPAAKPTLAARDDGAGIFYPGALHDLHGEPGHGKSWLTLHAGAEALRANTSFAALDYEGNAHTFVARMRALGVPDDILDDPDRVAYHNLLGKTSAEQIDELVDEFTTMGVAFVALDSMLPALIRNGYDDNSNADQAAFYETVTRPLTMSGAAICCVDHMTKDATTRVRGARGGGAKLQLVDVSYSVKLSRPFSKDTPGEFRVICDKDRFGTYSIGQTIAEVTLDPHAGGTIVELAVRAPRTGNSEAPFRPTRIMERASRALEQDGELNALSLRGAVKGDDKTKPLAIDLLVNESYIAVRKDGQTKLYRSLRPYRESDTLSTGERVSPSVHPSDTTSSAEGETVSPIVETPTDTT
jgi:hypothetical protein